MTQKIRGEVTASQSILSHRGQCDTEQKMLGGEVKGVSEAGV